MYHFQEDFTNYDDLLQPYSCSVERSSALPHSHAAVDERGFSLQCPGNKYIFLTPDLARFKARLKFMLAPGLKGPAASYQWSFIFAYDEKKRSGLAVTFAYNAPKTTLVISLDQVAGFKTAQLTCLELEDVHLDRLALTEALLELDGEGIRGHYGGHAFRLPFEPPSAGGSLGLMRASFTGELVFRQVELESTAELVVREIMPEIILQIPNYNGGQLPYRLTVGLYQYENGKTFLQGQLAGGLSDRPLLPAENGQYMAPIDRFYKPYLRLANQTESIKLYIQPGWLNIADINVHWDFLIDYFACQDLPLAFFGSAGQISKEPMFIFGYEKARSENFLSLSGGPTEYVFAVDGELLYMGDALEELASEIKSGAQKRIVSLIPKDLPDYAAAVLHAVNNHYFFTDEKIAFELLVNQKKERTYRCQAWLEDVFFTKITDLPAPKARPTQALPDLGQQALLFPASCPTLGLGVYHIVFRLWHGNEPVLTKRAAFEVFDENEDHSPQEAAGLPCFYSKVNEMRYLRHDVLDFLAPMKSCDAIHYFSLAGTIYPDVGTEQQVWRLLRLYRREWLLGLSGREVQYPHWSHWQEAIKNAQQVDYRHHKLAEKDSIAGGEINMNRFDLFKLQQYDSAMLELVDDYLDQRPHLAHELAGITQDFDKEKFTLFLNTCGADWLRWFARHNQKETLKTYAPLKKLNPSIRFSGYSPYPLYAVPNGTHQTMLWFGYLPDDSFSEVIDGAAQFEDYSFACSYPTHRGALAAATLRLWCPGLKLTPELYRDSEGGCPDGLVAYANPPLGKYWMPPYFQATQLLEYALATPVLNEEGFTYWNSNGAMFADPDPEKELPEFLNRWRGVIRHKPQRPLKAMLFLTDYPDSETRLSPDFDDSHAWSMFYNISEANQCQLYRAARESGLNAPIMSRFSCLDQIDSQMTDILVLPSLDGLTREQLTRLRRLHAAGVALVACGSIRGLEDVFGVQEAPRTIHLQEIKSQAGQKELVQPVNLDLHYKAAGARVLLYGQDQAEPLIMQKDRALLLNCTLALVNVDTFMDRVQYGRESISRLLFELCQKSLLELARPVMTADCGLSAFSDGKNDLALLIDYSPMRQIDVQEKITSYKLTLPGRQYKTATCDYCEFSPNPVYEGDFIKEIHVRLRPQETMLIKLD